MDVIASMATVRGATPGMADVARMAAQAIEGWLREYDGYRGLIVFTDEEGERARVITLWDSAEAEENARTSRAAMRDQTMSTVGMVVEETDLFEVPVFEIVPARDGRT
jgi:heme-degrading monooxygenase HmoA